MFIKLYRYQKNSPLGQELRYNSISIEKIVYYICFAAILITLAMIDNYFEILYYYPITTFILLYIFGNIFFYIGNKIYVKRKIKVKNNL